MSEVTDFSKHPLVERLLPLVKSPDYNEVFTRSTQALNNKERFLLKMEISRQAKPCQRIIDLRGKVEGDCREYQQGKLTHFLDDVAIKLLEEKLKQHQGVYNIAIFEALQRTENNYKVMQENNISPEDYAKFRPKTIKARALRLGHYISRNEERMHLISPLKISSHEGELIDAMSSNMSVSGLRAKVPKEHSFEKGQHVLVYFKGLEQEFANRILSAGTEYKVLGIDERDDEFWLRMVVIDPDEEFNNFFNRYLRSYRGRYRVDVDNVAAATLTKSYEHHLLPRLQSVPLFFSQGALPRLKYAISTQNNEDNLAYWRDENNQSHLGQLFHKGRLRQFMAQESGECLFYCFTHTAKQNLFFYSATSPELAENPELRSLYLGYGSRKPSWRVFKFQWQVLNSIDYSLDPALPNKQITTITRERIAKAMDDLAMVGLLSEVSNLSSDNSYQLNYPQAQDPNRLNIFNQRRHPIVEFEQIAHKRMRLRKEDRYQYRSLMEVTAKGEAISCWCSDFSVEGLKLECETPLPFSKDDRIELAMPQFQKLVKNYQLNSLKYRVVHCNSKKSIFHLQIAGPARVHEASRFFKQLISNNLDKLNPVQESTTLPGLSDALYQVLCKPLFCRAMFVHKHPGNIELGCVAYGQYQQSMDQLLNIDPESHSADLSEWMNKDELHNELCQRIRDLPPDGFGETMSMLLVLGPKGKLLSMRSFDSFKDEAQLEEFVRLSMNRGQLLSLQLKLARVGRPDTSIIQRELTYISQYAIHRAKQLEDELWSVVGVVEAVDTTSELLSSLNLEGEQTPTMQSRAG